VSNIVSIHTCKCGNATLQGEDPFFGMCADCFKRMADDMESAQDLEREMRNIVNPNLEVYGLASLTPEERRMMFNVVE